MVKNNHQFRCRIVTRGCLCAAGCLLVGMTTIALGQQCLNSCYTNEYVASALVTNCNTGPIIGFRYIPAHPRADLNPGTEGGTLTGTGMFVTQYTQNECNCTCTFQGAATYDGVCHDEPDDQIQVQKNYCAGDPNLA